MKPQNTSYLSSEKAIKFVVLIVAAIYGCFIAGDGVAWHEDDAPRNFNGIGWDHDGRPIATIIYKAIYCSGIINMAPLNEMLACCLVALAGIFILKRFLPGCSGYTFLLSLLPLASPLYVRNIFYVFDSLTMSAALFLGAFAYWLGTEYSLNSITRYFLAVLSLACAFLSYQVSALVFLSCLIFDFYLSVINEEVVFKEILKKFGFLLLVFLSAVLIHHYFYRPAGTWARDHAGFIKLTDFLALYKNLKLWFFLLQDNIDSALFIPIKIVFGIGVSLLILLISFSKRPALLKFLLIEAMPFAIILSFFGPLLLLANAYLNNRFLFSFGFLMLFSVLVIGKACQKFLPRINSNKIMIGITAILLWFSTINAVQFHNALAAQRYYIDTVSSQLAPVLIKLLDENSNAKIITVGNFKRSVQFKKYAAVNSILRCMWLGDNDFYSAYLSQRYNLGNGALRWQYGWSDDSKIPSGLAPVAQTSDYAIYHEGDRLWIKLPTEHGW